MSRIRLSLQFQAFRREDSAPLADWLRATPVDGLGVPPGGDRWIDHLIQDPNVDAFMAIDDDGRPLGFARVDFHPDRTAEITVIVNPEHRRKGVGAALVGEAADRCRRRGGCTVLAAVCPRSNRNGGRFFAAAGFRRAKATMRGFDRLELWLHEADGKELPLLIEP